MRVKSLSYKSPSSRYMHINIDLHRIYHIDLKNLSHSLRILHSSLQNIAHSSQPSHPVWSLQPPPTHGCLSWRCTSMARGGRRLDSLGAGCPAKPYNTNMACWRHRVHFSFFHITFASKPTSSPSTFLNHRWAMLLLLAPLLDLWSTRERTNAATSWPIMVERSSMSSHGMSALRSSMKTTRIPA